MYHIRHISIGTNEGFTEGTPGWVTAYVHRRRGEKDANPSRSYSAHLFYTSDREKGKRRLSRIIAMFNALMSQQQNLEREP